MNKLETELSNRFILNLRKQCTEHSERIKIFKIHGDEYQEPGISDWIGCWREKFIALEFKVAPNEAEQNQIDFLVDVIECGGVGIIIEFVKHKPIEYSFGQEHQILTNSFYIPKKCHYHFSY